MRSFCAGLTVLFLAGCTEKLGAEAARLAHGVDMYEVYCTSCHGRGARGDGPLADALSVRPADLTRLAQDNGGVFPYIGVMARIHGYPGQFHDMPQFGPLLDGPRVVWQDPASGAVIDTPRALLALVTYLASVQRG